jgi:hypothetical protein
MSLHTNHKLYTRVKWRATCTKNKKKNRKKEEEKWREDMEAEQKGNARSELDHDGLDENRGKNTPFFLPSYDDMNH